MTQIKGTFEGWGEAQAPLKLNEVFISHADSTLNTARSRAVTVNVALQSIHCLFSLPTGPEKTKGHTFSCYFFPCIALTHFTFFTPGLLSPFFLSILHLYHHPPPPANPGTLNSLSRLSMRRETALWFPLESHTARLM